MTYKQEEMYEEKAYYREHENDRMLLAYHRVWNGESFEYIFDSGHRLNIVFRAVAPLQSQVGPSEFK